jgi:hypothetical protein
VSRFPQLHELKAILLDHDSTTDFLNLQTFMTKMRSQSWTSILAILTIAYAPLLVTAQTNTFPLSGDVGIGTTAPVSPLTIGTPFAPASNNFPATQEQIYDAPTVLSGAQVSFYSINQPNVSANSSASNYAIMAHTIIPPASTVNYSMIVGDLGYAENYGSGNISTVMGAENFSYHRGGGTVTNEYGAYNFGGNIGGGAVTTLYGSYNVAANGGTGNVGNQCGTCSTSFLNSAGSVTAALGIYGSTSNLNAAGTITSAYCGYFDAGQFLGRTSTGTITNAYGIYIGNLYGTKRYSLYAADTASQSYFAGNVGIGTTNPIYPLSVHGAIEAEEVIVQTGWSDYVFSPTYRLTPLSEVEQQIKTEKHLSGIPTAQQVAQHGISLGDMEAKLLAKIEELTLHQIEQEKLIQRQNERLDRLERENEQLRRSLPQ